MSHNNKRKTSVIGGDMSPISCHANLMKLELAIPECVKTL